MYSAKKGFTLIELMVVVSIIGFLATLLVISVNTSRAKARDARRITDLRAIYVAQQAYFNQNNVFFPLAKADSVNSIIAIENAGDRSIFKTFFNKIIRIANAVVMSDSACSNPGIGSPCGLPYPATIGNLLNPMPIDPLNDDDHYYRIKNVDNTMTPEDERESKFCVIASKLESQNSSYYASEKSIGYIFAGASDCP